MTSISYTCKLCGSPGVAQFDETAAKDIEAWRSCLTCQRCYTFRDQYQRIKRDIEKLCVALISLRHMRDEELRGQAIAKIRERLTALTKRLAALCSDYYRVQTIWDVEMVEILMDRPEGCNNAVNAFRAGYEGQAKRDDNIIAAR